MDAKIQPSSAQNNNGISKQGGGVMSGQQIGSRHQQSHNNDQGDDYDDENTDSDQDEIGEEPPDMRVYPEFLKNLPGVQTSDSMGYRIEALRVYLENQLGDQAFQAVYKQLTNLSNDDDYNNDNVIESILGPKKMKFVPLVHQLIVSEDSYYANP